MIRGDIIKETQYAQIFNCITYKIFRGTYKHKQISCPRLAASRGKNNKKMVTWMGSTMSIAGRTTLINSSLTNTFIYHMSMYLLPKTTINSLDKHRRLFFWRANNTK